MYIEFYMCLNEIDIPCKNKHILWCFFENALDKIAIGEDNADAKNFIYLFCWRQLWKLLKHLTVNDNDFNAIVSKLPPSVFFYKYLSSCVITDIETLRFVNKIIQLRYNTNFFYHYQSSARTEFVPINIAASCLVGVFKMPRETWLLAIKNLKQYKHKYGCEFGCLLNSKNKGIYTFYTFELNAHELILGNTGVEILWRRMTLGNRRFFSGELFSIYQ